MPSRRQEKVARVIKEAVSDAVANHLSDPRIEGFVTVTQVKLAADLRNAEVYLSIMGKNESSQRKTFTAIEHAKSRIQKILADRLDARFCPVLRFHLDENLKKTLEVLRLIDQVGEETSEQ